MSISNIAGVVRRHAASQPDKTALVYGTEEVTFAELHARSNRTANAMAAAGVGHGDHVGFLDKNCMEFFDFLFGAAKLGAVHAGINWRLSPREITGVVNDAEIKLLIVGEEYVPVLDEIAGDLSTVEKILVVGGHERHQSFEEWRDNHPDTDPGGGAEGDDTVFLLYSSGTTGFPKGVMIPNDAFMELKKMCSPMWGFDGDSVNLVNLPMFHIGGVGWSCLGLYNGNTSIVARDNIPQLLVDLTVNHRVSNAFLVPVLLQFMLTVPGVEDADFSALRTIVYGGSPISEEVLNQSIEVLGCEFAGAYGLTESCNGVTTLFPDQHDPGGPYAYRMLSVGRPHPNVELKIVDPVSTEELATDEVGEIWLRSPQLMSGYWKNPEATAETVNAEGWMRTGDAGSVDADGFVYIRDRIKDMIISGGENIYPAEVENALMEHPGVADVAVIGVPSAKWGETPRAVIVAAGDQAPTEAEIIEFCRGRIAHYKCPTSVGTIDAIPRNPSGKILKGDLRDMYLASQG
ncbi:MAG: long-chain-fatty-acid--CoA ligase [Acidimicrobiia bacterium]|nr:long-chain-fatty-acid--CoA ligase [Acidimicrobiia bacterium]MYA39134.1 long-chain-fatty-acid--CoA ligase [Acidimicrobiia bacterium]MYH06049.1 long-chain-fatty-acid--CoA ligase [Acidimicrobiia bacterium]MYJ15859.1 long-chain-fatty-acid--CoA ligase [Acidimicrobiia bacterium]MYK56903.1 long-chain-fatty-acid--CoA ligase [Acidimicrobiia bacterium]